VDIIINPDKGDLEVWLNRMIVEDGFSEDDNLDIELSRGPQDRARLRGGRGGEPGSEDRGLRSPQHPFLKQNLQGRIMELEKDHLYNKYKERWARSSPARCTRSGSARR
jgi:N utilization substance protein A